MGIYLFLAIVCIRALCVPLQHKNHTTQIMMKLYLALVSLLICLTGISPAHAQRHGDHHGRILISGRVVSSDNEIIDFATIHLKGTSFGSQTEEKVLYRFSAPEGEYTLFVNAM